jgi:hypothetical protein
MRQSGEQVRAAWQQLGQENHSSPLALFERMARESFEELNLPDAANETFLMFESQLAAARAGDSLLRTEARRTHQIIVDGLAEVLRKMQAAGQVPAELDAHQLGDALLSFYYGARIARLVNDDVDTDAQNREVFKVLTMAARSGAQAP